MQYVVIPTVLTPTTQHTQAPIAPPHASSIITDPHAKKKVTHLASHQTQPRTQHTASSGNIHAAKRLSRLHYGCTIYLATYLATSLALDNKLIHRPKKDGANKLACSSPGPLVGHRCKPQYVWCHSLHRAAGKDNRVRRMVSIRDLFWVRDERLGLEMWQCCRPEFPLAIACMWVPSWAQDMRLVCSESGDAGCSILFRSIRVWGCFLDSARRSDGGCSIRLSVVTTSLLRSQEQNYGKKIQKIHSNGYFTLTPRNSIRQLRKYYPLTRPPPLRYP
jgi:hypothetical protein